MRKNKKIAAPEIMLGDALSFAVHEEYRLLRTNIKYSLSDEKPYHCIGVTSALKGEGKTTASINLAYTLAENGEKVCLLEADMRLPTVRKKLNLEPHDGLSEYLTTQALMEDIVELVSFDKCTLPLIQAGMLPPNPAELLASPRMERLLERLGEIYSYIIVDLPPVDMVSDAIIMGGRLDGVIMVVAQPICTKRLLKESMRRLMLAHVRVLGFVRTFVTEQGLGKTKYYKKGYRYNYSYQYGGNEYLNGPAADDQY